MTRVKIELPETFSFSTNIEIRIGDVNYGGHVGNDSVLSIMHEARLKFLKHYGYTEFEFGGVSMIMADSAIQYKGEAFYGDVLKVCVKATNFHRVGFDLIYKLENQKDDLIALGKTGMLCFDYSTRKLVTLPGEVVATLED